MKKICIVDDEVEIRQLLRTIIIEFFPDADINEANDGEEALKLLANEKYDLLLTDLCMPNMEGNDLISKLNKDFITAKPKNIIVISAHIKVDESDNVGNVHMFSKPFNIESLEKTIKSCFNDM